MSNERINPPTMYDSVRFGFSHASLQNSGRTVHLAGQVAWDANHNVVGGNDLAAQARQVLANLEEVLRSVGCTPADVLRLRTYVVNHSPDKLEPVLTALNEFYAGGVPAPNTWIGVSALALPEFLIEIEAVAAVPE